MMLAVLFLDLIYITVLICVYSRQSHVSSSEIKLFFTLLITNYIGLFVEILGKLSGLYLSTENLITIIITRGYFLYLIIFSLTITNYVYYVSKNEKIEKNKESKITQLVCVTLGAITMIISSFLPIEFDGLYADYCTGQAAYPLYAFCTILIIFCNYLLFKNFKNVEKKKCIPLFIFFIGIGICAMIQNKYPNLTISTIVESIVLFIMYFTIENPDVKMIEQLEVARDAAEKANHAKSDFLSNMSHEIRTPLNAIVGFSESLKDDNLSEESKDKVDNIIMASNNLLEIVNGILDISKIEADKLEIINKEYDVHSMLDELVALTKARIGDKGLEFNVSIDKSLPSVLYGDNSRIKQVILNLLTNAVKYTKEGFINFTVSSVIKDNICRLIVSVEDSGIGIKEESLPKLFSKFERLEVEKQMTIEGTGLGLAITHKLIDLMNGKVIVQSIYGKGSKFTVSIDQRIISIEKKETQTAAVTESKVIDAHGARVLVVDDNELNIKVASVLLKKYHFNIDSCTSGIECLTKIKNKEEYDIIFLDDMMPRMNGRETLKKLKDIPDFNVPVIVLTANAITGMKEEYLSSGFDDYLAKPIERPELERVIRTYLSDITSKIVNSETVQSVKSMIDLELPNLVQSEEKTEIAPQEENQNENKNLPKVLLVDDNELNIKVALTSLKKYDLDITSVSSGSKAIEENIMNKFDLILLDEMMPEMDGCKTLDELKSLDGFTTPVVMMSASPKDEVEKRLEEHGFADYLSKPFTKEELDRIINTYCK